MLSKIWLCSVLLIILWINSSYSFSLRKEAPSCDVEDHLSKFDCYPEEGANQQACLARGCCWKETHLYAKNLYVPLAEPYCYFPKNFPKYKVSQTLLNGVDGVTYRIEKQIPSFRPNEILNLTVNIKYDSKERLRVRIIDPNVARFEVPLALNTNTQSPNETDYFINVIDEPFAIQIFRKSTQNKIFDTSVAPLIFADQFIQFSSSLANNYIYGLGEHRDTLKHDADWSRYTFWNRDVPPTKNINLYGTHPFYITIEQDGNANGVFLLNSNAMDVVLQPYPAITFTTIGGIIDLFVYMGPKPSDVVKQHLDTIGRPFMPAYFTLGFHLSRWNYANDTHLGQVIKRMRENGIPFDTQWTDIDVMKELRDWTYDDINFSRLPEIVKDLHEHGQHYINIIDPAISVKPGYEPYDLGLKDNLFIKKHDTNEVLVGKVWPGDTVYPDFTHPNTTKWWTEMAKKFHETIPFDGIWIDMNEPSNFIDGSYQGCTENSLDEPPFIPKVLGGQLYSSTICTSAKQHLSSHYNLHNMYGHFEAIATNKALREIAPKKRPFVLSRSTFTGTGVYSAHWSGDNRASWDDLYYSIPSILNFNMFGISMIGADICGYALDTDDELCTRWMQLGSFYPFMRNHNDDQSRDQDPAVFSKELQEIMKSALKTRYSLLPYFYTLFWKSHVYGETVVRPLLFEYPNDKQTHEIDAQFMVGSSLVVSPVIESGKTIIDAYFPKDIWYDFYSGERLSSTGHLLALDAPLNKINVHIRGGHIVPLQHPEVTTTQSRKNPFMLIVALDDKRQAHGKLFWDDGESEDSIKLNDYNLIHFDAKQNELVMTLDSLYENYKTQMLFDTITIYGVQTQPGNVKLNGIEHDNFIYDDNLCILKIQYFSLDIYQLKFIKIEWY